MYVFFLFCFFLVFFSVTIIIIIQTHVYLLNNFFPIFPPQVLKWNFTQPREEFSEQLQEQVRGCMGSGITAMMFSEDFKQHLKAVDQMIEAVKPPESAPQGDEALGCLDVVLKWTTLRFFDTNPTVLIKVMQLLQVREACVCVCVCMCVCVCVCVCVNAFVCSCKTKFSRSFS